VAFGIHPDTNKPYSWYGGNPATIKHEELPYICEVEAAALVNAAVELLVRDFGYTRVSKSKNQQEFKGDKKVSGSYEWSEGFGEKKLKEYCDIVREAVEHHWDEARRKVFMFGRWCGGGLYDTAKARVKLEEAAQECKGAPKDYVYEVTRAFNNGVKDPAGPFIETDVPLDDFWAYLPDHSYLYIPTRELWPGASVDARIPSVDKGLKASRWLDQNQAVEQMTWAPGEEMLIHGRLVSEGGWFQKAGARCFNTYRAPTIELGDPNKAAVLLEHVHKVFNDADAEDIIKWCAQRRQQPGEKLNHNLIMGSGAQGIGKDMLLKAVKESLGAWNWGTINPQQALGRFNGFYKKTVLLISEARDLGDVNRWQLYEHLKTYSTTPPHTKLVDEKFKPEQHIVNCVGIIMTTNYKTSLYLPSDDRRNYVAWSDRVPDDFPDGYWNKLEAWYIAGGYRHVAAFLAGYDLRKFDPKAQPPKTQAFWDIVDANRSHRWGELEDAIDKLGNPLALTLGDIREYAEQKLVDWLDDPKNQRAIPGGLVWL
jgi:hypothetical protein